MKEWFNCLCVVTFSVILGIIFFNLLSFVCKVLYNQFGYTIGLVIVSIGIILFSTTIITLAKKFIH